MVGLTFPSGSSRLDDSGRGLIDRLQEALEIYPRSQVRVEGHTDSSGSPGANQSLSQKRATAVASYLIESAGLQAFRVNAMGYGDTRPVTSNRTAAGRAQNRRIDVVIITKPPDTF
jgi:outer membrane protein OmpA-like peptidoglycan-associated protein